MKSKEILCCFKAVVVFFFFLNFTHFWDYKWGEPRRSCLAIFLHVVMILLSISVDFFCVKKVHRWM